MRRVLVIGSGGAGKSTLATQLGRQLGVPVIHLDAMYWHPGWVPTPAVAWRATVDRLTAQDAWVMDGNYGGTLDRRLATCDAVIFLDLSRWRCLARVVRRWVRYRGRSRPDMAPGCPERLGWAFAWWVWDYPRRRRPDIVRRLAALPEDRQVIVLRSPAAVAGFMERVAADAGAARRCTPHLRPTTDALR